MEYGYIYQNPILGNFASDFIVTFWAKMDNDTGMQLVLSTDIISEYVTK